MGIVIMIPNNRGIKTNRLINVAMQLYIFMLNIKYKFHTYSVLSVKRNTSTMLYPIIIRNPSFCICLNFSVGKVCGRNKAIIKLGGRILCE